ncbi:MAG: hypothetical protein RLZZ397_1027 [Pseudomonadota bacterium]
MWIFATRWATLASLLSMIVLGLGWEMWWAPLREGGSWWAFKVLPLTLAIGGVLKMRLYTYRWLSLLCWMYFLEGAVRAYSDLGPSSMLALWQTALSVILFATCSAHVRMRLRAGKTLSNTNSPGAIHTE